MNAKQHLDLVAVALTCFQPIVTLFERRENIEAAYQGADPIAESEYTKRVDELLDTVPDYHHGVQYRAGWFSPDGKPLEPDEYRIILPPAQNHHINLQIVGTWKHQDKPRLQAAFPHDTGFTNITDRLAAHHYNALLWFTECALAGAENDASSSSHTTCTDYEGAIMPRKKIQPLPNDARPANDDEILRFLIWDGYRDIVAPRRTNGTWVAVDVSSGHLKDLGQRRDYYVIDNTFVSRVNGANIGLHRL